MKTIPAYGAAVLIVGALVSGFFMGWNAGYGRGKWARNMNLEAQVNQCEEERIRESDLSYLTAVDRALKWEMDSPHTEYVELRSWGDGFVIIRTAGELNEVNPVTRAALLRRELQEAEMLANRAAIPNPPSPDNT